MIYLNATLIVMQTLTAHWILLQTMPVFLTVLQSFQLCCRIAILVILSPILLVDLIDLLLYSWRLMAFLVKLSLYTVVRLSLQEYTLVHSYFHMYTEVQTTRTNKGSTTNTITCTTSNINFVGKHMELGGKCIKIQDRMKV